MSVYLWLLLISVGAAVEKRNFQFIFDTINVIQWAPDLIEELNYSMLQLNNRSYVNGNLILKRNIDKLALSWNMDFWRTNNKKIRLFNLQMDTCLFLTMVHKNPILNTFSRSFKNHTTGELKCPFKATLNYSLHNWYMDEQEFPSYVPEGAFQTITDYFIDKKKIARVLTRGRVLY